jgi:TorA maturation chaperone TorD
VSAATPLPFQPPEAPEDQARAGYYALLARLFYAGPDAALLESMARADEIVASDGESPLANAWNALAAAARAMDAEAARVEYDELFVGTGKSEVTLYASFYLVEAGREKILARLRAELAGMGLERTERALEPEDHIAGLFDAMRYLISLGSSDAALRKQQEFFDRYIARSHERLCAAISASGKSNFYKHVARFAEAFLAVESEAMKVF